MMTRKKIYTLIVDNHDVSIISRQRLLEDILYRLNMIYEYADELDDLTQEINLKLDKLIEKAEKKNHDPSSDGSILKLEGKLSFNTSSSSFLDKIIDIVDNSFYN